MAHEHLVGFEFECVDLPCVALSPYAHLRLGIQEGDTVRQDVPCTAEEIRFRFTLRVTADPDSGDVTFGGSYAQGPRAARFVYLCWGVWGEGGWQHFRRAKIPLNGLDPRLVERALRAGVPIRARIRMTDARGEPVAATVPADQIAWWV